MLILIYYMQNYLFIESLGGGGTQSVLATLINEFTLKILNNPINF